MKQGGHHRPEGDEEEGEGDRERAPLGAVGLVGARPPEVEVEGGLPRPPQRRPGVGGAQLLLERRRGLAQGGQEPVGAPAGRREAHDDERALPSLAEEERVTMVSVGEDPRHLRPGGERVDHAVEGGPTLGRVGCRDAGEDEDRVPSRKATRTARRGAARRPPTRCRGSGPTPRADPPPAGRAAAAPPRPRATRGRSAIGSERSGRASERSYARVATLTRAARGSYELPTSRAARLPDSMAPFMKANQVDVCSPAKWTCPSGRRASE